jgi:hypothetical protein
VELRRTTKIMECLNVPSGSRVGVVNAQMPDSAVHDRLPARDRLVDPTLEKLQLHFNGLLDGFHVCLGQFAHAVLEA